MAGFFTQEDVRELRQQNRQLWALVRWLENRLMAEHARGRGDPEEHHLAVADMVWEGCPHHGD